MGWDPAELGRKQFLILSTHGGVRAPDGTPIALGYHTGHWEIGLLVQAAARGVQGRGGRSRSPGSSPIRATAAPRARTGMFDSLPYRNDAAQVFRRLIRSLPDPRGRAGRRDVRQRACPR